MRSQAPCKAHTQPQFVLVLFLLLNASESWSRTVYNRQQRITTLQRPSAPGASVNLSTRRWFQWATSQKTRVHSQNRKKKGAGYWLCSTPKWALWFSALSHQLSEQCAANKKHFINIPSDRSPVPVNTVPRRALVAAKMHSGSGSANRLLPAAHETVLK